MKHLLHKIRNLIIAVSAGISVLLTMPNTLYAEGTKQVRPDSTISGGSLMIDRNDPMYTRFGCIGCPANYRLYIHIKNVGETILFGLQTPLGANIGFNLRRPNGTIAMTGNLPVAGAGYIRYYRNAIQGPFPAFSGYTPLSQQITSIADTGDWYFEIKTFPNGGNVEFNLFDFQVVTGLNSPALPTDTINGRLWSQAWQLYANLGWGNTFEPFNASFYVYSDDGITTKLKFSGVHWGEGTIFCNPVGCLNTGNFPVDRQSSNNNTYVAFPGIAWYKVFLNNPDSAIYHDGEYGRVTSDPNMIDDPNYPVCSGKKYIEVVVNKIGSVIVRIDVPYGDSTYDVTIESNVKAGLNHIPWDGLDGHGGQVPEGTWLDLTVTFINGLTNLPLWDIEQNPLGYKVDLVRPTGPTLQEPLIYWDDSQLSNDGNCPNAPTTVNLAGCVPTTSVCHDWEGIDCHEKMINSWWFSGSSSTVLLVYYGKTPDNPVPFNETRCGPGIDTLRVTVFPAFFTADWYSAASGGTLLLSGSKTFITPPLNTTTTFYALTRDSISGCISARVPVTATVLPLPVMPVTLSSNPSVFCFNQPGTITLTASGGAGTTLRWYTGSCGSAEVGTGTTLVLPVPPVTTTYFARWEDSCGISACNSVTVFIQGDVLPGAIATDQTICSGGDPATLTSTLTGSGSGIITYRWESFSGAGPWTVINGANGDSYDPPSGLITTTLYRRITISTLGGVSCESQPTPIVTVIVNVITPGMVGSDQQICSADDPAAFTELASATGSGIRSFQWQNNTSGCAGPWSDIPGAINSTYNPPPGLVQTTFFRRVVTFTLNGVSCSAVSGCITITVLPTPLMTASPSSQVLCSNGTTGITLFSSILNTTYTWTTNIIPAGSIAGASNGSGNNITQTLTNTTSNPATVTYIITPTANNCLGLPVNVVITVIPAPNVTATPASQTICSMGETSILLSSTTASTNFTWTIVVSPAGSITGASDGAGNTILQTLVNITASPATVTYTIIPTANGCTGIPADVVVTVKPVLVPSINGPTTVCINSTGNVYSTEAGMTNYNWTLTGGIITAGAGTNSITVTWNTGGLQSVGVTYTDANGCNPELAAFLTINIISFVASVTGTDVPCYGDNNGTAIVTVSGGSSGYTFLWDDPQAQTTNPATNLAPGTYTVLITDANLCSLSRSVTIIQEHPTPSATLSLIGRDGICQGNSAILRFDLTGTPPWSLTFSDGNVLTTVNGIMSTPYTIQVYPANTCIYTITALTDLYCTAVPGMMIGSAGVDIFPIPGAEFTWTTGPQNYEVQFHIDSSIVDLGAVGYMVLWNFGDGTFGYGHNPVHFYPGSTTFHCILTVTDTNGCQNSVMHDIFVPPVQLAFYSSTSPTCLGNLMCFQDLSTVPNPPANFIQTWIWNFGDGTPPDTIHFPDNPDVCHAYNGIGTYPVSLTIRDNWGTTSTYVHDQQVIPVPVASYSYTTNCEGQPVQFTDNSHPNGGGNIISWNWDFGDPISGIYNTSILENPSHSFTTGNNSYNVRLIIQNLNGCGDTVIRPVYILPKPPVDYTHDSACNGQVVHYAANPGVTHIDSIVTWSWDFGDGSAPSNNPVTAIHTYSAPGTYITTLTVSDHHGCMNSVSHGVKVNPLPVAVFSWSSPVCYGNPVQYTDHSTVPSGYTGYIAKWLWEFGDGTSQLILLPGSPDVTHTFAGPGTTHTVRLTVWTSDSCSQFVEHVVVSIPSPVADFDISTIRCKDQPVQFTDLSQTNGGGSIAQWEWNFDDPGSGINNTSGVQNPVHTYLHPGTYSVTLVVTNFTGCSDTINKVVNINVPPVAEFHADTACLHALTQFTDHSIANAANIISYTWDFGDGSSYSHLQNPAHTYATYGIFNVKLTVVNSNGCAKDTTQPVLVNPLPEAAFSFSSPNCLGAVVQYTDLSTTVSGYLGSIVKWVWDFGDGTSVTILAPGNPNVSHTFAGSSLSHVVRLTVTTSDGCTGFTEHTVNSIPSPVADFGFPAANCTTPSVQFTDHSQPNGGGLILSWHWDFGDPVSGSNNVSTLENPVHYFATPGTYNITLVILNVSYCSDTVVKTITISSSPLANFIADTVCLHQPTQFSDVSVPNASGIIAYLWDFGDGSPASNQQNPTHTYLSYGVKNVKLTITNSNGCMKDTTKPVLVHPLPLPEFTFSTMNCHGSSVQFTDGSTTVPGYLGSIVEWVWDFGDGTPDVTILSPASPNVIHIFAGMANAYTVRLTVTTSDGCSDFIEHVVNSMASPSADFTYPSGNCAHQMVQFTDISQGNGGGNITQWQWDFGDPVSGLGNTSALQNPSHLFSSAGIYTVREIVHNASNCPDTSIHTITVNPLPLADYTADTACFGSITSFTDQSSPSAIITQHLWEFGDGTTSTLKDPVHAYPANGFYQVKLTVTTQDGCIKDTTKTVLVVPRPVASFTATGPTCLGNLVHFTDNSNSQYGLIHSWTWDFGDGTIVSVVEPASPNISHLYTHSGVYTVLLTVASFEGCISTTTNPVEVQPAPTADYIFTSARCEMSPVQFTDMTLLNGGSPVTQWLWNFGDPGSGSSNSSTLKNPVHSFSASGNYNVTLHVTTVNGCVDSITKPVSVSTKPIAQFSADTACAGSATQFIDHSIPNAPGISSWQWNFGDPVSGTNNTSTLQNPSHIFSTFGNYLVSLTVINSNLCVKDTLMLIPVPAKPVALFQYTASCVNTPTQFTDLSTAPNGQLSSWFWDFGDGAGTSTLENPLYTYTTPGTYNVKLRVTNTANCQDSIIIPVVSHPLPVAAFAYNNFFCPAGQVIFHDQSQGNGSAIAERLWIFEPGSTSTLHDPTYVFPVTDTSYLVSLIVTDDYGCKDTTVESVYVKPGFSFTFNYDTVCYHDPTHFHGQNNTPGDSLYSIQWNFGDPASGSNNTSTLYNPKHIFSSPKTYNVKLKVWNSDNCVDSIYRTVVVDALPKPGYSYVSPPCDSLTLFTDQSSAGSGTISSWTWDFGDGSPLQTIVWPASGNTEHVFEIPGTYRVSLKVTNTIGCSDTMSQLVGRPACISASFIESVPAACSNSPVSFTDNSYPVSQISQWHWTFGDDHDTVYTKYSGRIWHTYASSGIYQVRLVIHAGASGQTFTDTASVMVPISQSPEDQFSAVPVCLNQVTLFKDLTNTFGTDIASWKWSFGDPSSGNNNFSDLSDPSHQYMKAGQYNVTLVVINKSGCRDSIIKPTKVFALPDAKFINTLACSDNPTYFFDRSIAIDTTIERWHWNFGVPQTNKDTSMLRNPDYNYKKEGNYDVLLIIRDNHGCYDTVDSTVTVNPSPISAFLITENFENKAGKILVNNKSEGADSYFWDFGNGYTSTDESPVVTYSRDGIYNIMLASFNHFGCSDTTYLKYELLFKGLYIPNAFVPVSDLQGVNVFKPVGINLKQYKVQVFDSWGNQLWESSNLDSFGRPVESWNGRKSNGELYQTGTYVWKISATFIDGTVWEGSDIGKGDGKTIGTVTLIR